MWLATEQVYVSAACGAYSVIFAFLFPPSVPPEIQQDSLPKLRSGVTNEGYPGYSGGHVMDLSRGSGEV